MSFEALFQQILENKLGTLLSDSLIPEIRKVVREELDRQNGEGDEDLLTPNEGIKYLQNKFGKGSTTTVYPWFKQYPALFVPQQKIGSPKNHYFRKAFRVAALEHGWEMI